MASDHEKPWFNWVAYFGKGQPFITMTSPFRLYSSIPEWREKLNDTTTSVLAFPGIIDGDYDGE